MSSTTLKEIDALKKKKAKALEKGNLKEVAELSNLLGEILHRAGQLWDAIEQHEEERQYCEVLADRLGVAFAHRKIGECHFDLGEYSKALRHQKLHLQIAEEEKSDVEQQRALATIGRTYFQHGSEAAGEESQESGPDRQRKQRHLLRKAEAAYVRSLEKCEALRGHIDNAEYHEMKTRLLLNIGLVFQEYNDSSSREDARKHVLKSLTLAKRLSLREDIIRAASALADMCLPGDVRAAAEHAQTALDAALKTRAKEMQRDAMAVKAKVCLHQEKYTQAKHLWKKIYKLTSARSNPEDHAVAKTSVIKAARLEHLWSQLSGGDGDDHTRAPLLDKCAAILVDLQAPGAAVPLYKQLLKISANRSKSSIASTHAALAEALSSLNQHREASEQYQKEARLWGGESIRQAWTAFQNAIECLEFEEDSEEQSIVALYYEALDLAQKADNVKYQKAILRDLLTFHKRRSNPGRSEATTRGLLTSLGADSQDSQEEEESEEEESQGVSEAEEEEEEESDVSISVISDTDTSDHEEEFDRSAAKDRLNRQRWEKKRNGKGETPLHVACIKGELDRVKFLIKTGHPLTMRDYAGWLPLHEACSHGHGAIVSYLLAHGADKDARGDQATTPLIDACSAGHLHVAHLLIDAGADITLTDNRGSTALSALRLLRQESRGELTRDDLRDIQALERRLMGDLAPEPMDNSEEVEDSEVVPSQRPRMAGNQIDEEEEESQLEDSEEPMLTNPYIAEEQEENPHQAGHMYRELLHNIRSRNTTQVEPPTRKTRKSRSTTFPPPALVTAAQDVGDDWIEDDLGHQPRAKRRRKNIDSYLNGNTAYRDSAQDSSSSPKRRNSKSKRPSLVIETNNDEEDEEDSEIVRDNNENLSPVFTLQNSSRTLSQTSNLDNETNVMTRFFESSDDDLMDTLLPSDTTQTRQRITQKQRQTKLTDFTTDIAENPRALLDMPGHSNTVNAPVTSVPKLYPSFPSGGAGTVRRIQVKIQDTKIIVPVQGNTNVGVLASEAAKRYHKLCGVRPRLALRTTMGGGDGAALLEDDLVASVLLNDEEVRGGERRREERREDDLVASVLLNDEEVEGIVQSWDLQPLKVRYTQACADLGVGVYEDIASRLNEGIVSLTGLSLSSTSSISPLSRAMHCHTTLTHLHLAGVGLSDADVSELPLSSLTSLQHLDLSGNCLSHKAVHSLGESLLAKPLQSVRVLDLSHSCLGAVTGNQLCGLLEGLPGLRGLRVSGCQLQPHTLHGQHRARLTAAMTGLTEVDVSYNRSLGVLGCELLLHCLNAASIRTLNLSATVLSYTNDLLPNHLVSYVSQSDCVLEKLYLNNCSLTSEQTARLTRLIAQCPKLQHLSLNTNPHLHYTDISALLTSASSSSLSSLHAVLGLPSKKTAPTSAPMSAPNAPKWGEWELPESLKELWLGPGIGEKECGDLEATWRERWGQEGQGSRSRQGLIKLTVREGGN